MQFTLSGWDVGAFMRFVRSGVFGLLFIAGALTGSASAESVFVDQARSGSYIPPVFQLGAAPAQSPWLQRSGRAGSMPATPEMSALNRSSGNLAQTLQIGNNNQVFQLQSGQNNYSNVGILAGNNNSVGVLQAGHNLRSNLVLLGTAGLSVGVIQPNGSAPVNMLIARLPNGGLLIKR